MTTPCGNCGGTHATAEELSVCVHGNPGKCDDCGKDVPYRIWASGDTAICQSCMDNIFAPKRTDLDLARAAFAQIAQALCVQDQVPNEPAFWEALAALAVTAINTPLAGAAPPSGPRADAQASTKEPAIFDAGGAAPTPYGVVPTSELSWQLGLTAGQIQQIKAVIHSAESRAVLKALTEGHSTSSEQRLPQPWLDPFDGLKPVPNTTFRYVGLLKLIAFARVAYPGQDFAERFAAVVDVASQIARALGFDEYATDDSPKTAPDGGVPALINEPASDAARFEAPPGAGAPPSVAPVPVNQAEQLARRFHEHYERLAPEFGYETRKDSAKPWSEVPDKNKRLMTAVCAEILAEGVNAPANQAAQTFDPMFDVERQYEMPHHVATDSIELALGAWMKEAEQLQAKLDAANAAPKQGRVTQRGHRVGLRSPPHNDAIEFFEHEFTRTVQVDSRRARYLAHAGFLLAYIADLELALDEPGSANAQQDQGEEKKP